MSRPSQQLHPARTPAPARLAATVLLLRDTADGPQVLMTRRSASASFAPGAYVFPGGGVDPADAQSHSLAARRSGQSGAQLTEAIAGIRESFEELGVLLARHADGRWADQGDIHALDRQRNFAAQCAARGLTLAANEVHVLARWTTDRDLPQRFEVPFLVARMPPGQHPVADETEQFEALWLHPRDALARHHGGRFFMIYPTIRTLERLLAFTDVAALLQACAVTEAPLWVSCPRSGLLAAREARCMEHEPAFGELALVCPDGQIAHPLDWQSERPVPLLKNLQRLTAPNPGAMTGPGTNSYLVGDPDTGYIVIDPGPADAAHLEKLWRAAGGDIRMIVCTHSHPDHAPGAPVLQALCRAAAQPGNSGGPGAAAVANPGTRLAGVPPILGLPSAPTARAASQFTPDRALTHGELLHLGPIEPQAGAQGAYGPGDSLGCGGIGGAPHALGHTLQVIHTPGHAANHLCLVLLEDGLLFSGDHILNGSTTVVDPPDGDMNDYLASLEVLSRACTELGLKYILPAHGYAIGGPDDEALAAIARLKAHRLQREARVLAAMQALPDGTPDDWLALAYADVPQRMWPVAKRSLLAHLARIVSPPPR